MFEWTLNQQNEIKFVMVDAANNEVAGLGNGFTLEISKPGNNAFATSAGTKTEIGSGWYRYLATAAEADSVGVGAIRVTGAGAVQQNLIFKVLQSTPGALAYTYTVTDGANPLEGVEVWITTDSAGAHVLWHGLTDALGVARDLGGELPYLDPGTYYFWKQLGGYMDDQNPDTEVVS